MAFTAKKKTAPKASKAPKAEKKPKGPKIGEVARKLIMEGKTNEQVIAEVKKQFPGSGISNSSVNWYKSDLREAGKKVPEVPRQTKPSKVAAKATLVKGGKSSGPLKSKTNIKPTPDAGRKPQATKATASKADDTDDMGI